MNKKSLLELRKLSIEELAKYYKEQRKEAIEEGTPLSEKSIRIRNKVHQLLLQIVIIDRILNHETVTVLKDERIKNNHPISISVLSDKRKYPNKKAGQMLSMSDFLLQRKKTIHL